MPEYLAPGVYVEEIDTGSKPIEGVSTSTAGMIGVTERGPVDVPILVTGTGEFTRWFGERLRPDLYSNGPADPHWLFPHAIEGFFTNGGKRVYVTRVLDTALAQRATTTLFDRGTAPSGATVLLRAAREATGTGANPPLLVVLDSTNLAPGDFIRIGDGSDAEYRSIASPLKAENVLVPVSFPLSRSHDGPGSIPVEQFTPAIPLATYAVDEDTQRADQTVTVNGAAADIGALAVDDLIEIGPDLSHSEHRFVRQVDLLSATRARVRLDSGLLMPYHAATTVQPATPVRRIPLGAGPPTVKLDPSARAGETMLFVDDRQGAFDARTDLIVINRADAATREVRRIGELHSVTIAPAAADAYSASSLVEGVALNDYAAGVVTAATPGPVVQVSDITTLSVGQTLLVGPLGGGFETVIIQSIAPGAAPAGTVTLTAAFATPAAVGEQIIAVRTLTADAPAGASFIAIDNRLGLSPGDVIRVGAVPDDEYALVAAIPNPALAGVRPDAGTVLLASPLLLAHARTTTPVVRQDIAPVVPLYPTVTALAVARGDEQMLLSDGEGYGLPHLFVRVTTAAATYFHRVVALTPPAPAPGAVIPQMVELDAPLDLAHPVGTAVIGRQPLFDVEALDAGIWGDRLRVTVEDEDPGLVSRTTLASVGLPTQIRLGSTSGVEPGTILELLDPATGAPVGGLLKVGLVNRLTGDITLDGTGLDAGQQAAHAAAIGAGTQLGVRSREFRLTVRLLRQPDPANPSRNETVLPNVELFRYLSMDPRHSRFAEAVVGAINGSPRVSDRRPEGESWYIRVADRAPNLAAQHEIRLGPETLIDVLPDGRLRAARHPFRHGNDSIGTLTDAAYVGVDDPTPENRTGLAVAAQHRGDQHRRLSRAGPARCCRLSLIEHCELMRYRFAVLDGPRPPQDTLTDVQTQRQQFDTKYAALYHPWLLIPDPFPVNLLQIADYPIPPRGHMRRHLRPHRHRARRAQGAGQRGRARHHRPAARPEQGAAGHPQSVPGQHQRASATSAPNNRGIRVYGGRVHHQRSGLEVRQRAPAADLHRGVDRPRPAVGRVRAERGAAVGARAPLDHQLPHAGLAQRRARGHEGRRGVLRQVRPHDDDADRHRQRTADLRRRRRAGEAGRVRDRPHRPVDGARRRLNRLDRRRSDYGDRENAATRFASFNFQLEIDGMPLGAFSEVQRTDGGGRRGRLPRRHRRAAQRAQARRAAQVHEHHAQARLHAGHLALGLVPEHRERRSRPAQRHDHADERRAPAGAALARRERLDQQDRRAELQGERQRGRDGVGRARPRGPDDRGQRSRTRTMATVLQTPGVYYERADAGAPVVSPLRTDIAGFVGIATRGPLHTPVARSVVAAVPGHASAISPARAISPTRCGRSSRTADARCWIVRVASEAAAAAALVLRSPAKTPIWRVVASSPGVWGNDLDVAIRETHAAQTLTDPLPQRARGVGRRERHGVQRGTHVRLSQHGAATIFKVVSAVDAVGRRLVWRHPRLELRLPYDAALTGFDPNDPLLVESVEYTLLVQTLRPAGPRLRAALARPGASNATARVSARSAEPLPGRERRPRRAASAPSRSPSRNCASCPWRASIALDNRSERCVALINGGADGLALLTVNDFIGDRIRTGRWRACADVAGSRALDTTRLPSSPSRTSTSSRVPPVRFAPPAAVRARSVPAAAAAGAGTSAAAGRRRSAAGVHREPTSFAVQAAMIEHCERRRDRIAIARPAVRSRCATTRLGIGAVRAWRQAIRLQLCGASTFRGSRSIDPLRLVGALTRDRPASGPRRRPSTRGPTSQSACHKAPANGALAWVQDVTVAPIDDATHGVLNPRRNQCDPRVCRGAGCASSARAPSASDPDWRYVNVRRLLMMIEKASARRDQWAVFEPNDASRASKLTLSI